MESQMMAQLFLLAMLFTGSACFSSCETALVSLSRHRLRTMQEHHPAKAPYVDIWLKEPNHLITTLLVGNNIVNVSAAIVAEGLVSALVQTLSLPAWVGTISSIGAVSIVVLVLGEITPKIAAYQNAERVALMFIKPLVMLDTLLSPFRRGLIWISNLIIRLFGGKPISHGPFVTQAEILGVVTIGEEQGVIDKDEREMIHGIIEFGDTRVREVMVPRPDMVCAPKNLTIAQMSEFIEAAGITRVPVYEKTLENIVGIVNTRDLVPALNGGKKDELVSTIMREAYFVPETKMLDEMLREFKSKRIHMAVVVDEHGGTCGLVTLEDLLEEIVGEIRDEYDVTEEPLARRMDDGSYMVDGRMDVEELNEMLNSALPEDEDYGTLGGFIFSQLGKIPRPEDFLVFDKYEFKVMSMHKRRIQEVHVKRVPPKVEEGESEKTAEE